MGKVKKVEKIQKIQKIIAHCDVDAFFAAVEERNRPQLRGKPIVIGSDPMDGKGRGVVSTANYAARAYGIHSAQPISHAWKCSQEAVCGGREEAVFISPSVSSYKAESRKIFDVVHAHAGELFSASIDEAYVDLSHVKTFERAQLLAQEIRKDVYDATGLIISIGISSTPMLAKIASDLEKPDALTIIRPEHAASILSPLSVRVLPGVGPKTAEKLLRSGISVVADLQKKTKQELIELLGERLGASLYKKAWGTHDYTLAHRGVRKSLGEQRTFMHDTDDIAYICARLKALIIDVIRRFHKGAHTSFRTIVVTVRFADFDTHTHSRTLPTPCQNRGEIYKTLVFVATALLMPFLDRRKNPHCKKIRLIGVRIENFA